MNPFDNDEIQADEDANQFSDEEIAQYDIERKTTDGKIKNTHTGESYDSTTTDLDDFANDLESGL